MSDSLFTVGVALGGCAIGCAVGWPIGRSSRERPIHALSFIALALVAGCYVAWRLNVSGATELSAGAIGAAFGAMTAVKYASGLIPGLGGSGEGGRAPRAPRQSARP